MSNRTPVNVIGCGGHAKVVLRALAKLGHAVNVIYDDNPAMWRRFLMGIPIVGPIQQVLEDAALPTVLAIGDNNTRRALARRLDLEWFAVIDPQAIVDPSVRVGRGTVVLPGAIVQVDSQLGEHVIINTGATVDHDCVVEDYAHIAPGANLGGSVAVGEGTLVGIGAAVLPGRTIGEWSVIGAGAVVLGDIPEGIVAIGVPAAFLKPADHSAS